jgi:hypothetical protein
MRTDDDILAEIAAAFGDCLRPEHFTNYTHCEECAEHDEVLRSRDLATLTVADVGNPGWDPICFCTPEGLAYYMPALSRLALAEPDPEYGWYGGQLVSHLWSGGEYNRFYEYCTAQQRRAVASLLSQFVESRAALVAELDADQILQAYERWSA